MPVPSSINDLSTTAALNFPAGTDSPSQLDDVQRAHASFIAQLRDDVEAGSAGLSASSGSSLVGYLPAGPGAVATTVQSKLREIVSVRDFGVLGNGTDETAKVQDALNYLNSIGEGELHFNGEVVRCDSPLIGYTNIKITGTPGSTIDWSHRAAPFNTPGDGGLLVFRGTASAEILLTADAVYKTNKISVPDASLFAEGDLVEVSMNSQGSFPDTSVATKSGQLNIIVGVYTATNTLVLDTPIFEPLNYTTANGARIRKITPVENIVIEGMTFKGFGRPVTNTSGDLGVRVFFGRNVTIRNCVFDRLDSKAIEVISCHQFVIENNEVRHDKIGSTNNQVGYGIAFSSSQYGTISSNKIVNPRHGIVSSHLSAALTNDYYGISRFINIHGNHVTGNYGDIDSGGWNLAHAGISTHSDVEYLDISNNNVSGCAFGINPRTCNISILNNTLVGNASAGIYLSGDFRDFLIANNYISGGTVGLINSTDSESVAHSNIKITNNTFDSTGSVSLKFSSAAISYGFDFSGNSMTNYAGTSGVATVVLDGAITGTLSNNTIDNAGIQGIRLDNTKGLVVSGNSISRTSRSIDIRSTCQKTVVVNNTLINNAAGISAPAASQSIVSGNHEFGTGAL